MQHLTTAEVNELIKPSDEALDLVHEWLLTNGISKMAHSPGKDWVHVLIDVETAERLLDTVYYTFEHKEDGSQVVRAPSWSLPKHLHEHVDTIQPTNAFSRHSALKNDYIQFGDTPYQASSHNQTNLPVDPAIAKVCNINGTTPTCFKTLYKTLNYTQKAGNKSQIAFSNYLGEIPISPDAAQFASLFAPEAVPGAYALKKIDIADGPSQSGPLNISQAAEGISREANLDFETILGMTYPMPITSYSTGGVPPEIPDAAAGDPPGNEPYLDWVNYVLSSKSIPQVISTSYGDDEQTVPKDYAIRVCKSFAQLGARGVSLLFSSGDGGAGDIAGNTASECISNDGKNTTKFLASFPVSCPYVTGVGATMDFSPEVSAYRNTPGRGFYSSGSGFSEYFPRPSYQDAVVPAYVKSMNGEHTGLFNPLGRGYPDIAAQGLYFKYVWNGTVGTISGTSASSPLAASVIALVNDALIASGRSPLGFLNPWLYKHGYKGFTDITSGLNGGCNTTGFPTVKGWDAVTGFGTPIFPTMVQLAKQFGKKR